MSRKHNRTCIVCGQNYQYCISCTEDMLRPTWYTLYHNENCRNLFNAASDYLSGAITKEEAKERFDVCDMSYRDNLHHKINKLIDEIYETNKIEEIVKIKPRSKKISKVEKIEDSPESETVFEQ